MPKPVLGHDPFTRPAQEPAPQAKPKRKRKAQPRKRPKARKQPARKARAKKTSDHPAHEDVPVVGVNEILPGAEREIDRVELLEGAEATEGSFQNPLYTSARFVRPSFYGKKLGEVSQRFHAEEVDDFGFDPVYWQKIEPFLDWLFNSYWRVELAGIENIPADGPVLLVANHAGALPYDGTMLKLAVEKHHPARRPLRFLTEDFVFHFPFVGTLVNRIGGVRACQDNARRLLDAGMAVAVFPEGVQGIGKLFRERYRLQRFGRGGFIKLAIRSGSPIVPVAVVGAEEVHPVLAKLPFLSRPLGLPFVPLTPTFPLLGPLGALPLPSKWIIRFGEPVTFDQHAPEDAENDLLVMEHSERVRSTIQAMVDEGLKKRGQAFF